jgi:hypothetical protein
VKSLFGTQPFILYSSISLKSTFVVESIIKNGSQSLNLIILLLYASYKNWK